MSKVVRQKHTKIIELLKEATDVTARLIQEEQIQDCLVLLVDCQDSAVALGSHIEKLYGMGTKTVSALESYCEALYQLSVALEEQAQVEEVYEGLRNAADLVKETYEAEFPDKKEVVFLPYKASMWDSLESVWMAARDDEECEAYVVPIPYYDLDENQNFKEMHYEGDQYPKYVPITSYTEYDIEERHPDMIFIHNPYDQYNRITSIAPEFYSSRIKDFTEKLVYIPYFILPEINPKNQVAIDGMSHFCYQPGTIYADQVIVQSEDMREIYINEYMKASKERGGQVTREELEQKFLGLGSPKVDKAVNTRKEDLEIPEEWLRIIEKPDGTWKKIIFYNTSVAPFLQNSEQMLLKIKDVLRIFKENQDEVALLWRPHPLMMQTVESMRPNLRDAYKEIAQQYKDEGWGIYDDTADMDRAVVLSDAYYGDQSSVVQLYQETGKPVMIQEPTLSDANVIPSLLFECVYVHENCFWVSSSEYNGLFKFDKNSTQAEFVGFFPNEDLLQRHLYRDVTECNGKLYFAPRYAKEIAVFDLEKKIFEKISFNEKRSEEESFFIIIRVSDCLYFIPEYGFTVIQYDCKTKRLSNIVIDEKKIGENCIDRGEANFICYAICQDKIILPSANSDNVVIIDTKKNSVDFLEGLGEGESFIGVHIVDDIIYFITLHGKVIKLDMNLKNKIETQMRICKENVVLYPSCLFGKDICTFALQTGETYILNTENNLITQKELVNKTQLRKGFWRAIVRALAEKNILYVMDNNYNINCFNNRYEKIRQDKIKLFKADGMYLDNQLNNQLKKGKQIFESSRMLLNVFITNIEMADKSNLSKQIGCKIKNVLF